MIYATSETVRTISVKLGADEDVPTALVETVEAERAPGAAVASAAGSLAALVYVLVEIGPDGRPAYSEPRRHDGTIELLALGGHIGRDDRGRPGFHLHGAFGLPSGKVVGGHLLEARVLVTLEVTLVVGSAWNVVPWQGSHQEMNVFVPGAS